MKTITTLTATMVCALALTACGGGDDNTVASNSNPGSSDATTGTDTSSTSNTGTSSSTSSTDTGNGTSSTGTSSGTPSTGTDSATSGTTDTGSGASGTSSTTSGSTLTYDYKAVAPTAFWSSAANMVSDINAVSATGYRYLSSIQESGLEPFQGFYVNDSRNHTYTLELVLQTGLYATDDLAAAAFSDQLNQEGAKGYRYSGSKLAAADADGYLRDYNIYIKDTNSTATYSYILDTPPGDSSAFLTQANKYGASGYWFKGIWDEILTPSMAMYEKDSTSNASYTYQILDTPTNDTHQVAWIAQANSQGAQGYRALRIKVVPWSTSSNIWVYVKDANQSATFAYQSVIDPETKDSSGGYTLPKTNAGVVTQANSFGTQGYWFLGDFPVDSIFIEPINCNNFQLCGPTAPGS